MEVGLRRPTICLSTHIAHSGLGTLNYAVARSVYITIFGGFYFAKSSKSWHHETFAGFNFREYVACLVLRPVTDYFRECKLTCKTRED